MKKVAVILVFLSISACVNAYSVKIPPERVRGWGVRIYEEGAEANGVSSYIYLRVENLTARDWNARILCKWFDAGTEEEFAREETTLRLNSYTLTRTMMRQYFFTEWRIRIHCSIEELVEIKEMSR